MHLSRADHYRVEENASGKVLWVRTKDGKTWEYESLTPPAEMWMFTAFVELRVVSARRTEYSHTIDVIPGTEVTVKFGKDRIPALPAATGTLGPSAWMIRTLEVRVARAWCDDSASLMYPGAALSRHPFAA